MIIDYLNKHRKSISFFVINFCWSCGESESTSQRAEDVSSSAKVIQGTDAQPGELPDVVEVQFYNDSGALVNTCSGSIIFPGAVLTAAHCVLSTAPNSTAQSWSTNKILVMRANKRANATGADYRQSRSVWIYSQPVIGSYIQTKYQYLDVAVIGLATRWQRSAQSLSYASPYIGQTVTITGYGENSINSPYPSTGVRRYGTSTCTYVPPNSEGNHSVYWGDQRQGSWYGDSGAPVYADNCAPNSCFTLVSLVSTGYGKDPYSGGGLGASGPNLGDQNLRLWLSDTCQLAFRQATPE